MRSLDTVNSVIFNDMNLRLEKLYSHGYLIFIVLSNFAFKPMLSTNTHAYVIYKYWFPRKN